jgi:Protein of unknown function (DUF3540)
MNEATTVFPSVIEPKPVASRAADTVSTVLAHLDDGLMLVAVNGDAVRCRRAFSCLVEPEPGDRVTVSHADPQCRYVLAILERANPGVTRISIDGDLVLQASRAVRIVAASELSAQGERLALTANAAEFDCGDVESRIGALRLIGRTIETVVERVVQISRSSFRSIERIDHLRTAHLDHAATETARLHGKHLLLSGERLSKLDAEQIHLG